MKSRGSKPAMTSSMLAMPDTERASGPQALCESELGRTPAQLTRPIVGLMP